MNVKDIREVIISFQGQMVVQFQGEVFDTNSSKVIKENHPEKKDWEKAYFVFTPDKSEAAVRLGVAYFVFKITSGELDHPLGEYEVEWCGQKGKILVSRVIEDYGTAPDVDPATFLPEE